MRLSTSIAVAALSGLTTAASSDTQAEVFLLVTSDRRQQISQQRPELSKEVARHVLLQRTSNINSYGSDLRDLPESIDSDSAVGNIATYGRAPYPLFSKEPAVPIAQLVVMLEGVTPENVGPLIEKFQASEQTAAFVIPNPPSATANERLMDLFDNMGVVPSPHECNIDSAINPFSRSCWKTSSAAAVQKYDLKKSPETVQILVENWSRLTKFVDDGDLEATLILLPESSRSSKISHWSAAAASSAEDLRRRQNTETVIAGNRVRPQAAATALAADDVPVVQRVDNAKKTARIPQCFNSFNACMKQTSNCTSHGQCVNKYGKSGNASSLADTKTCFVCSCAPTVVNPGKGETHEGMKTVQWGGNMCQKKDISVPFWLLTGFTITIIGAITFAIQLLYSVGSEPLPGVIGAGVIRSSK